MLSVLICSKNSYQVKLLLFINGVCGPSSDFLDLTSVRLSKNLGHRETKLPLHYKVQVECERLLPRVWIQ